MCSQSTHTEPHSQSRRLVALDVLLVVSVALNVALAYRVRGFVSTQDALMARLAERQLKPGTAAPPISATRVDGDIGMVETIRYDTTDLPTVLYVLSPQCGWCVRNEVSISRLVAEKGHEYRFVALSLVTDGAAKYWSQHDLGMPLYADVSEQTRDAYKMGATPQTIVVSPDGVVIANWNGAYLASQKDKIEAFFKVSLPDVKRDAGPPGKRT